MKITIELTPREQDYLARVCVQRVMVSAIDAVPIGYEHIEDLFELSEVLEPLRHKLNDAVFQAKLEERYKATSMERKGS